MDDVLRQLVDRAEISDLLHRYATGIDSRRWDVFASCFTDPVSVDYSSANGDPPVELARDDFVTGLAGHMSGYDATQHISTNHVVTFDGDDGATAVSYLQATHVLDGDLWVMGGSYTNTLVRAGDGWKIRHCRLTKTWETGDPGMRRRAHERGRAAG